jgi:outer membrane protein assembly factor BamD (BamD/ComL family)
VLLQAARLHLDHLDNRRAADSLLLDLTQRFPSAPAADDAALERGRIALLQGRLDDASLMFAGLEERLRVGDLAERARLERALVHFYRGEFASALTLVEILSDNTSDDTANDAIALTLLLTENESSDSLNMPLRRFASVRLLHRQGFHDAALDSLEALAQDAPQHALADEILMLRADALRALDRPAQAADALARLVDDHPDSYLADRALVALADVHALTGAYEAAREALTRLLTDYPASLYAERARTRIRELRGDAPS